MMIFRRLAIFAVTLGAFHTGPTAAQISGSVTQAECDAAVDSLAAGTNAGWDILFLCGDQGGNALGFAIRAASTESESEYLLRLWTVASAMRHPNIFDSAKRVANDDAASVAARATALLILESQYDPSAWLGAPWVDVLSVPLSGLSCPLLQPGPGHMGYAFESPLPSNFKEQIADLADAIRNDEAESPVLRGLAGCLRRKVGREIPVTIPPWRIRLFYLCDNKFKVTNSSNETIHVSYTVIGTTETAGFVVPANDESIFFTLASDSTSIIYQGTTVATKANAGTPCT